MKPAAAYKIIFWDFDGVIKDSVDVKTNAFVQLFESYGSDVASRVRAHHEANGGMSRYKKMPVYLEYAKQEVTTQRVEQLCNEFSALVMENVINAPWVAGAKEYLRNHMSEQAFYLVSATPHEELLSIVEACGLTGCFKEIYGAPVSKTDAVNKVLQQTGVFPVDAVFIGDAGADREAAVNNRIDFILRVHSTNRSLTAGFSGRVINDITEL